MARLARENGRWSSRPKAFVRSACAVLPWDPANILLRSSSLWKFLPQFLVVSVVGALALTGAVALAQTDVNDVHVVPREIEKSKEAPKQDDLVASTPNLSAHVRPLKVDVDLVLVPVTVTDPLNRLVTGLEKDNFQLFEGSTPQDIRTFSSEDAPVSLGVIFDSSGSMSSKMDRAKDAVIEFFKTANPQDEFFMITFSDEPEEVSDFTSSVDEIQSKLVFAVPRRRTALLDAIYMGVSKMIYAIGIYDRYASAQEERLGPQLLGDITELSGGRAFTIDNPNDLGDVATKIGVELRNQYVLGYRPNKIVRDGKWRKIKVKLLPPKGLPPLRVYARTGYYAPAE